MTARNASLRLVLSPTAARGDDLVASVATENLAETIVTLSAPDTVVISQPHRHVVPAGSHVERIVWRVEHVQAGTTTFVEVTASSGQATQTALCRIVG